MKESGWNFQRISTMSKSFYKSGELNDSRYAKIPLRSSPLVKNRIVISIALFGQY